MTTMRQRKEWNNWHWGGAGMSNSVTQKQNLLCNYYVAFVQTKRTNNLLIESWLLYNFCLLQLVKTRMSVRICTMLCALDTVARPVVMTSMNSYRTAIAFNETAELLSLAYPKSMNPRVSTSGSKSAIFQVFAATFCKKDINSNEAYSRLIGTKKQTFLLPTMLVHQFFSDISTLVAF